jgi:elongator complex protein 3
VSDGAVRRSTDRFDPSGHERELVAIIAEISSTPEIDRAGLDRVLKRYPKDGRGLFSRSEIISGFRHLAAEHFPAVDEARFVASLRLRPVRTQSGVTPVTVLTKPYPCPGRCVFCPNDVRMPKSYLADEPGAQRAEDNRFDPYLQTWNRLDAYHAIGHPIAKVELIVLGGTWSFHPEPYQIWFAQRCFDAMNDYGRGVDGRAQAGRAPSPERSAPIDSGAPGVYNQVIRARLPDAAVDGLHESERASWADLAQSQARNEAAGCRNVGLVFETRPDHISSEELVRLRRLGATKVQIGLQSLSDAVLQANQRGCDVAASRRAMRMLRGAGFKLHAHWMANLLGATPELDAEDFARLFDDADFRPDELKLYPCSLIESAELMDHYRRGAWRPYQRDELVDLLAHCLERVPAYCRVTRVIRDFSSADIVAGNRVANLREVVEAQLQQSGRACRDIRAREIRAMPLETGSLELRDLQYESSIGSEHFLEFATPDDRLAAFCRLSLPGEPAPLGELVGSALIREVHVYGDSLALGGRDRGKAQHAGLGRRLVERAAQIARAAGFGNLAVISAVGTRAYYRSLGFADGKLYQHLALGAASASRS